jgi:tetratricopeptide (TPR) repeat protein
MRFLIPIVFLLAPSLQDAAGFLRAADGLYHDGRYRDAEDSYIKALSLDPQLFDGLIGLARTRIASGETQGAVLVLNEALSRRPADRNAKRLLGQVFVSVNMLPRAEPILRELVETDPMDRESFFYLGTLMYQNGYFGAALADFEKSVDQNAEPLRKVKTEVYRAVCLSRVGRTGEAEEAFQKLALQPDARKQPDLLLVYAELLYETGRPELALNQADQAIKENNSMAMAYFWRSKILFHLNRQPEAAAAAERAVQILPQLPYPHSLLVRIYQSQGKTAEAMREADWLRDFENRFINGPSPQ